MNTLSFASRRFRRQRLRQCVAGLLLTAAASAAHPTAPADVEAVATAPRGFAGARPPDRDKPADALSEADPGEPLRWTLRGEVLPATTRWSASRGALDLGLTFERGAAAAPAGAARERFTDSPQALDLPSFDIGLRRVHGSSGAAPASSLLERISEADRPSRHYDSKLGLQWKPAASQVSLLREGLGMRLQGNDRLAVRLRKGRIGVYLYRRF